jgi:pimeloyl-ACP methyl ester carboxylesterase
MSTGEVGLATHRAGTGPAVLWLHGYTMDSTIWRPLWERLPGWCHIGVDLPGHGASPPLARDVTLAGLAADIASLARSEQASRVVALSFGTMIALQLAIDHRDAVRALVVGAPTVAGAPTEPGTDVRYRELHRIYRTVGAGPHMTDVWMRSPPDIFRHIQDHPHARDALRETINRHSWQELATGAMHSLTRARQPASVLCTIEAAILVLVGDADMATFRDNASLLDGVIPDCRTHTIAGAGHLCLLERPDKVAPRIAEHLLRA